MAPLAQVDSGIHRHHLVKIYSTGCADLLDVRIILQSDLVFNQQYLISHSIYLIVLLFKC